MDLSLTLSSDNLVEIPTTLCPLSDAQKAELFASITPLSNEGDNWGIGVYICTLVFVSQCTSQND